MTPFTTTFANTSARGEGLLSFSGPFIGSHVYTSSGTYTWTCPSGITSISFVLYGGGGGGGGYGFGTDGTNSYFNSTSIANAGPGLGGGSTPPAGGGSYSGSAVSGGYAGTQGGHSTAYGYNSGGGAGTLGGSAGYNTTSSASNGGGGNGGTLYSTAITNGGPGTGTNSSGNGGVGGTYGGGGGSGAISTGYSNYAGGGGSCCWVNNYSVTPGTTYTIKVGSSGTAGPANTTSFIYNAGGNGGSGSVRIVWPGTTRQFPSTSVDTTTNEVFN